MVGYCKANCQSRGDLHELLRILFFHAKTEQMVAQRLRDFNSDLKKRLYSLASYLPSTAYVVPSQCLILHPKSISEIFNLQFLVAMMPQHHIKLFLGGFFIVVGRFLSVMGSTLVSVLSPELGSSGLSPEFQLQPPDSEPRNFTNKKLEKILM